MESGQGDTGIRVVNAKLRLACQERIVRGIKPQDGDCKGDRLRYVVVS